MRKTVVIDAVGLTPALVGEQTPRLAKLRDGGAMASVTPMLPAVTTAVQTTYLTGQWPSEHGIVGNGWYYRDEAEVHFWKQADALVQTPRIWSTAKALDPTFTCSNVGWWYAMYSAADYTVTPRPMYPADGRKLPDVWTHPPDLRTTLQQKLGTFPLFRFWGPATDISATQWLVDAAIEIDLAHDPTLSLVYLPHLDYGLQRRGPGLDASAEDLRQLDGCCGRLIDHFSGRGARVVVLSEYGIEAVSRPVHLNRVLRGQGLITVREERGLELLDAGASAAFAVADHQIAHVYVNDPNRRDLVRETLLRTPGVEQVLDRDAQRAQHLDHPRSGDFVAIAEADAWFTYYYWNDDRRAPDFARTVDIHRKPGYDPVELFLDPKLASPKLTIAWTLLRKAAGQRTLMRVIPLDASLVKGSHGRASGGSPGGGPLLISSEPELLPERSLHAVEVHDVLLRHLSG